MDKIFVFLAPLGTALSDVLFPEASSGTDPMKPTHRGTLTLPHPHHPQLPSHLAAPFPVALFHPALLRVISPKRLCLRNLTRQNEA